MSFSGARMVISTDAGGPAAMTRSTRSGTSTWRPAESTTSRPAIADTDQTVASTAASSSRSGAATSVIASSRLVVWGRFARYRAGRATSGADRSPLPHQLAHGTKFFLGRGSRDVLD